MSYLNGRVNHRDLILIACGCYRLAWSDLPLPKLRTVIEVAEQLVDAPELLGEDEQEIREASQARVPQPHRFKPVNKRAAALAACYLNGCAITPDPADAVHVFPRILDVLDFLRHIDPHHSKNQRRHAEIIRCIVGNPFRPVAFDPRWRTETAVALAAGIYELRAFDRLPILADALEEAGCDHPDVLAHCRGPGPHARGCWVVDGVLGK
jgi:hypothetical protein